MNKVLLIFTIYIGYFTNCNEAFQDPDLKLNAEELIISREFKPETHSVVTNDEITLTLHRIIDPLVKIKFNEQPVLLNHPLLGSSVDFILNSPGGFASESIKNNQTGNNLAFELAKRGYDVWLANVRGNIYSSINFNKKKWDFSLDEIIQYDMPAMINYILQQTNSTSINYIGYSQGATVMFGLLSSNSIFNQSIKRFIALAPAVYLKDAAKPVRYLLESIPVKSYLKSCSKFLYNSTEIKTLTKNVCPHLGNLCETVVYSIVGFDYEQLNRTRLPVYVNHIPAGTSCKNLRHFMQLTKSEHLLKYDYGWRKNILKYGDRRPPEYDLSKITLNNSISIIFGANDFLTPPKQVELIKNRLKVKLVDYYLVHNPKWNHLDFIWGKDVGKYVNSKIYELLTR